MQKTQEDRCKFDCPIRHPSRDTTKIRFHICQSVFDKKWGKWHFCDAPLNFAVFDLKIKPRIWTARAKKLKAGPFFFFSFFNFDKLWSLLCFFGSLFRSYLSDKNKKIKKAGFQFVGGCMINIVSKNHTQIPGT